jgi:hypothetical protein
VTTWSLIAALALTGLGILLLLYRGNNGAASRDDPHDSPRPRPDPSKARDDDLAWEVTSLRLDPANHERNRVIAASRC